MMGASEITFTVHFCYGPKFRDKSEHIIIDHDKWDVQTGTNSGFLNRNPKQRCKITIQCIICHVKRLVKIRGKNAIFRDLLDEN